MPVGRRTRASVRVPATGSDGRQMSRWGDEKTLFFIACYKNQESLWNPASYFYKSKEARANAYASLLEQFQDPSMTVQLVKTKIKNIRTTYHQELNKLRYSRLSGQEYKPTLCWFDAVDAFLGETVHKEPLDKITSRVCKKFDNFKRKLTSSSDLDVTTSAQTEAPAPTPPAVDREPPAKKTIKLVTNKLMKRPRHDDETGSEKSVTPVRLESTPALVNTAGPCEDEFHFFGMNVAAQLRRLPVQAALQLQTEFQSALYLARVHGRISPAGEDMDDVHTVEENSDSESVEDAVEDKVFQVDFQLPQQPLDSTQTVHVFKKAWDES